MALAEWSASHGYPKTENLGIEIIMQALADAGYNSDNWTCLTQGYQVYWYDIDNRMILYNSSTNEIEYPEEYIGKKIKDESVGADKEISIMLTSHVHVYNENHERAQNFEMSLNTSNITTKSNGKLAGTAPGTAVVTINGVEQQVQTFSLSSSTTVAGKTLASGSYSSNSAANLQALASNESLSKIAAALSTSTHTVNASNLEMYATKEDVSALGTNGSAYASIQICSVAEKDTLVGNGDVKPNVYYISIAGDKTGEEYAAAKKAAAQYIYNVFDQITTGKVDDNISILIAPGTEIDCSNNGNDWAPCKTFTGYFGTTDSNNKITINGASLTNLTSFGQTVHFDGTTGGSHYYVTGFFGAVYGNTTIENIKFTNISIVDPAYDATVYFTGSDVGYSRNRNTVGIIGAISDGSKEEGDHVANVLLKGIEIDSSCTIKGFGCVGGLVGYVGTADAPRRMRGEIHIENCSVAAEIHSSFKESDKYGDVGGLIGYVYRTSPAGSNVSSNYYKYNPTSANGEPVSFADANQTITWANKPGDNLNPGNVYYYCPIYVKDCVVTATLKGGNTQSPLTGTLGQGALVLEGTNDFSGTTFTRDNDDQTSQKKYGLANNGDSTVVKIAAGASVSFPAGCNALGKGSFDGSSSTKDRYYYNGNINFSSASKPEVVTGIKVSVPSSNYVEE